MILPLSVLLVKAHGRDPRHWPSSSLALLFIILAPLIYCYYLLLTFGDFLLAIKAHAEFERRHDFPWITISAAIQGLDTEWLTSDFTAFHFHSVISQELFIKATAGGINDLVFTCAYISLAVLAVRRLPLEYSIYPPIALLVPLLAPAQHAPLEGLPRYGLVLFPLFIALAHAIVDKRKLFAIVLPSAFLLLLFSYHFSSGLWVA